MNGIEDFDFDTVINRKGTNSYKWESWINFPRLANAAASEGISCRTQSTLMSEVYGDDIGEVYPNVAKAEDAADARRPVRQAQG